MLTTDQTVLHAYGVVETSASPELPDKGIAGVPVETMSFGRYATLVSRLPEPEFGADSWEKHGRDPRWLAPVAEQHHAVLQRVVEQVDVLPLRLPGVYVDEERLTDAMRRNADTLDTVFSVVRGHVEWGVKVFARPAPDASPLEQPTSGSDYLRRRADQAGRKEEERSRRKAAVLELHESLALACTHAAVSPPQDPALSGRREPMVLNAAYLVGRSAEQDFLRTVAEAAERAGPFGLVLDATGPWPPYSFAFVPEHPERRG